MKLGTVKSDYQGKKIPTMSSVRLGNNAVGEAVDDSLLE